MRNPSIELFRVLAMLGICIFHASIVKGHSAPGWWINLWPWCVNAFVFITGYFGCSFRPSKVLRLWGTAVFCALVVTGGDRGRAWTLVGEYWFLHAYVFLMCFTPVIDRALIGVTGRGLRSGRLALVLPILLLVFGWSCALKLPGIGKLHLPTTPGLGDYSGLALIGTYVVARLYRLASLDAYLSRVRAWIGFIVLLGLSSLGLCEYDTPVAAGLAGLSFYLVSGLEVPPALQRIIFWIAPSMFAVYLLHVGGGWTVMRLVHMSLVEWKMPASCSSIVAGITVFLMAVAIDQVRRILTWMFRKPMEWVLARFDTFYLQFVGGMP